MTTDSDTNAGNAGLDLEWRDGDMPYSPAFGDHFYCQTDGRLECGHVFLAGNGLPERWSGRETFRIGELGFGTGLNFCETWRQWKAAASPGGHLSFTSSELYPMPRPVALAGRRYRAPRACRRLAERAAGRRRA